MIKNNVKYHYMSIVTGEICEDIWEVITSVYNTLKHGSFVAQTPITLYIKYVFLWRYSKQEF